jgi:hypothetical protein
MKNLLAIGVFALYALCMMLDVSCVEAPEPPSTYRPPLPPNGEYPKGPNLIIVSKTQSLNANATKKDASYTKTYTLKIDSLFKTQTGITDLSKLYSVYVGSFQVEFDQANCAKLESYLVEANFPKLGKLTNSDCKLATDFGEFTAFGKAVKNTDFSQAIKDGESITVTFTMKAKEDLPAGVGITIKMALHIQFLE